MIKRMLIAVIILFGVLLMMLPKTDGAAKKKMASAAMLMCSNDFRKEVAALVQRDEVVQLRFNNSCPELIAALEVDEEGEITLHGAQHGIVMVLTPVDEPGGIRWSCHGEPLDALSKLCKP